MYTTVYFRRGRSVSFELQVRSCSQDQIPQGVLPYQILIPLLAFPRKAQQFLVCQQLKKSGPRKNTRSTIAFK